MTEVLLVGAGRMGMRHLRGLLRVAQSIVVVDPPEEALADAEREAHGTDAKVIGHRSLDEALGACEPDAVILAETAEGRLERVRAIAERGVAALLVEKPLEQSRERTRALAEAVGGTRAWANHFLRGLELFQSLRSVGGGLDAAHHAEGIDAAIVAIREDEGAAAARALVDAGVRSVLIEKPGALEAGSLRDLGGNVVVGYNRRFYSSVTRARELVGADGGALSCFFDFTEVEPLVLAAADRRGLPAEVLARWGIVNSLHVIDLAFALAGKPREWSTSHSGSLDWHPSGAVFRGGGTTATGAAVGYLTTWSGVGRWGIEVTTANRKLVLRPLEELHQQLPGSFALEAVELEPEPSGTKPGFLEQARAFLAAASGQAVDDRLCTAAEAAELVDLANGIFGYA